MKRIIVFVFAIALCRISLAKSLNDTTIAEAPIVLHTKTGDIFGTLTTPQKFQKIPVALIIAGSGPTDRNCNGPMTKTDAYKMLAKALAQNNIATVRYDKRGIAESKAAMKGEDELRFEDFVNDAKQWVQLIKKDKRFSEIIVIGHSEGSLIGMLASGIDVKKFISIAGAGRSADEVLKEQFGTQPPMLRDAGYGIIDSLKNGYQVKKVMPALNGVFRPSVQPYIISWFKYNPSVIIKTLKMPVQVIQGKSDMQVKVTDAELLHAANVKSELVLLDSVNHVLKKVDSSAANFRSYNDLTIPIDEELTESVIAFIQRKKSSSGK